MFILHLADSVEELNKGRGLWFPRLTPATAKNSASVSCPSCGDRFHLDRWLISDDGSVTPEVSHRRVTLDPDFTPTPECIFHEWIRLANWVSI
jgi:hypothetical protein